ncbi:hypothetical protein [Clavibacter sp. VKM Ac-2872]|uniref:hypothetical protein n=1 Tax=Clavibacter sp. VKM Ac-2872 TaxID=2783812 RepID=UPI00188BA49A|nr:hypothetical protein [Clavibacter sp. VKM Ac-2872]MBF4625543.1 hypothetical protein [Clavibacter sp. VKM Ac-2872]
MAAHIVTAACVVLPLEGGGERYLYRGAPVGEGFTEAGIQHALDVGLIAVDTAREEAEAALAAEEKKAAAAKAAADKKAADAAKP